MRNYLDLLAEIIVQGEIKGDRTGVGTRSLFGKQIHFDLRQSFPLVTTKRVHTRSIIHELLWFLKGDMNIAYLRDNGVTIWDEWADEHGDLGPIYGAQWRMWQGPAGEEIDQIKNLIEGLKADPFSRRHVVSAWNPVDLPHMALAPCHCLFQFNVGTEIYDGKNVLSCHMYQRSADVFLGLPFNIASYALLTNMVAHVTGYTPGDLIISLGDVHLYRNHIDAAYAQIDREPLAKPRLVLNPEITSLFDFKFEDIEIVDYNSHPAIPAPVAV